jgi:hypothetical protein
VSFRSLVEDEVGERHAAAVEGERGQQGGPGTPGCTTAEKLSASMAAALAARTLAICVHPPAAMARRCGPTIFSMSSSRSRVWAAV